MMTVDQLYEFTVVDCYYTLDLISSITECNAAMLSKTVPTWLEQTVHSQDVFYIALVQTSSVIKYLFKSLTRVFTFIDISKFEVVNK